MKIANVYRPVSAAASIEVRVTDVGDATNDSIAAEAMAAAKETPASLFGWDVVRNVSDPDRALVRLHRD